MLISPDKSAFIETGINRQDVYKQKIPIPNIEKQQEIIAKLDREMEALEGVWLLRQEAEKRIEQIITETWGEEIYQL